MLRSRGRKNVLFSAFFLRCALSLAPHLSDLSSSPPSNRRVWRAVNDAFTSIQKTSSITRLCLMCSSQFSPYVDVTLVMEVVVCSFKPSSNRFCK
jgi:hypothetical protein